MPVPADDVDGRVGERVGLLLHEEDLEPESLLAEHPSLASSIRAVAVAADPGQRSPAEVPTAVTAFTAGAVADAASRTTDATVLDSVEPSAVLDWASAADLDTVVVPYAPVGPVPGAPGPVAHTARRGGRRARHRASAVGRAGVAVRVAGVLPVPGSGSRGWCGGGSRRRFGKRRSRFDHGLEARGESAPPARVRRRKPYAWPLGTPHQAGGNGRPRSIG